MVLEIQGGLTEKSIYRRSSSASEGGLGLVGPNTILANAVPPTSYAFA